LDLQSPVTTACLAIGNAAARAAVGACLLLLAVTLSCTPAVARETMATSQAELIRSVIASVVNITARIRSLEPSEPAQAGARQPTQAYKTSVSAGSGFVIDSSGLIATNWHVLTDAFEIVVTFSDGTRLPARVMGAWRLVDLAMLKVDAGHPLQAVRWGDSSAMQIGDPVLAMGNAFGVGLSVSAGIVSALNRNIHDSLVDNFIQTDAAINHGNSGGPLFNLKGEVIGVNSAIISPTLANAGLGFAIPSNDAQFVLKRMVSMPDSERPGWLGAKIQGVTPEMAEAMGQRQLNGALVSWVLPGEPAQKAGMEAGDVILRFDGAAFTDERALLRQITQRKPGEHVTFSVWRRGQLIDLHVTLDPFPPTIWERNTVPAPANLESALPPDIGLTLVRLTDALRTTNGIAPAVDGLLVTAVAPGSDAALQGVEPGDIILQIGSTRVRTLDALRQEIDRARRERRHFGMVLLLPKKQSVDISQFPGPTWFALRIAAD
jgi:serine protease Do